MNSKQCLSVSQEQENAPIHIKHIQSFEIWESACPVPRTVPRHGTPKRLSEIDSVSKSQRKPGITTVLCVTVMYDLPMCVPKLPKCATSQQQQ